MIVYSEQPGVVDSIEHWCLEADNYGVWLAVDTKYIHADDVASYIIKQVSRYRTGLVIRQRYSLRVPDAEKYILRESSEMIHEYLYAIGVKRASQSWFGYLEDITWPSLVLNNIALIVWAACVGLFVAIGHFVGMIMIGIFILMLLYDVCRHVIILYAAIKLRRDLIACGFGEYL